MRELDIAVVRVSEPNKGCLFESQWTATRDTIFAVLQKYPDAELELARALETLKLKDTAGRRGRRSMLRDFTSEALVDELRSMQAEVSQRIETCSDPRDRRLLEREASKIQHEISMLEIDQARVRRLARVFLDYLSESPLWH